MPPRKPAFAGSEEDQELRGVTKVITALFAPKSRLRKRRRDVLGQHAPHIFVKRASLRKALHGLLDERIIVEFDLVAGGQTEHRDESLFFDLPLDPIRVGGNIRFGVVNILFIQIAAEKRHHLIVYLEIFSDSRLGSKKVSAKTADASLKRKEYIPAQQRFLKVIWLGRRDHHVRSNAVASAHLPAAIGQFHFVRLRILMIEKVVVERDVLEIGRAHV